MDRDNPKEGDVHVTVDHDNTVHEKYIDGYWQFHREDGPALIYTSGRRSWFIEGKRHRLGGPAIEDGKKKTYFILGKEYSEMNYWCFTTKLGKILYG